MPTILIKKSDTPGSVPGTANLTNLAGGAEVAVNTADRRMYSMNSSSAVVELGTNPSSLTCADGSFTLLKAASASITNLTATSLVLSNLSIASANVTTLTSASATITNLLATSLTVSGNTFLATSSGNVGIGTSSPISKLSVLGSGTAVTTVGGDQASNATIEGPDVPIGANFTSQLGVLSNSSVAANTGGGIAFGGKYSGNAFAYYAGIKTGKDNGTSGEFGGYLSLATRANGGNVTERLRIDSAGNLGLGVTPSAWGGTFTPKVLQVGATTALYTNLAANHTILSNNQYDAGGGVNRYLVNGYASTYTQINGQHQFSTAPSGTAGNAITFTQAMTLDASGQLGLGTTTPGSFGKFALVGTSTGTLCAIRDEGTPSGNTFLVSSNANGTAVAVNSSGNVLFGKNISVGGATPTTSGTGITFPATQSASSDANTLDDYEEGTWTPVATAATAPTGVTYNYQGGWYRKIGSLVVAGFGINIANVGTGGSGELRISGLPFNSATNGSYREPTAPLQGGRWVTAALAGQTYWFANDNQSYAGTRYQNNADTEVTWSELQGGNAGVGTYFNGVITYHV